MVPLAVQESLFPARVVYDLLFFFIVIIIVLNLIFGVIIDTFADLRSEKQKKEEILKTTCFICGEAPSSTVCFPLLCWRLRCPGTPVPPLPRLPHRWMAAGPSQDGRSRASCARTWETTASTPWASTRGT